MPSYFDRFGPVPTFSNHAWRRLNERGVSSAALQHALATEPKPGASTETVIYSDERVAVVVNTRTGVIVTLWWTV